MSPESILLALGILSASFFGSWHCGAMCGPICTLMKVRGLLLPYHFGRWIAYTTLGVLAGGMGSFLMKSQFQTLRVIFTFFLALSLCWLGLRMLSPKHFKQFQFQSPFKRWVHEKTLSKSILNSGLLMGLSSALLPCGWLYTYVLAAAATQSPFAGAVTMSLFWLGGLPVLSAVPSLLKKGLATANQKQQRIAGAVLLASSFYSLVMFYWQ